MNKREIFQAALELTDACRRAAYLEKACSGNPSLQRHVEHMLEVYPQLGEFLESPAIDVGIDLSVNLAEAAGPSVGAAGFRLGEELARGGMGVVSGDTIGPYRLLEQIGEGGFGIVFMAEQTHPVRRQVALKVLKPGMDTRQVIARFEAERQALALMDHPHVARVFDGGETASGLPYFVMELIRGEPITSFCDENRLGVRERLELFVEVCQAVQHAHAKGIIHRDLKPSNVLISRHDATPVVKVIDFGVAKAVGQQLTEKTLFTNFAQLIGTPLYMSPEQAGMSDLDVDIRSDIYSLGVLLYELLTGTTPFDAQRFKSVGFDELRRIIREEEPPRPSMRISTLNNAATTASTNRHSAPRQLSRLFCGELDWIVMKALEKDRERRYETASAFASDVHRYLDNEPVLACPPSAWYRLRKLVRRHRVPAAVVCAVLAVLAGGIATTSVGFLSARAAQRRAEENFEIANSAVDDYLNKVTEDPDLNHSDFNALRKKLLVSAVPFYQRLVEQKPGDAAQAAARGRAYARLGDLRRQMGETTEALADFEQMRSIFARLAADFPTVPEYRSKVGASHDSLGTVLSLLGRNDEAESAYRAALGAQEKLADDFPAVSEYRENLAKTGTNLGVLLRRLGRHPEAEAAFRAALAIRKKLAADFPMVPEYRASLAGIGYDLGNLLAEEGRLDEAGAARRAALAIREELVRDFPTVPQYRDNLGELLDRAEKPDEAEAAYRAALPIQEKLAADFPTIPQYREQVAGTHNALGLLLARLGRRDEAEAAFRAALAIRKQLAADFPTVPKYRDYLARGHNNLGALGTRHGERDSAEVALRAALAIREKLVADFPTEPIYRELLAATRTNLGDLLTRQGKRGDVEASFRAAVAIYEQLAVDFPTVPKYRKHLADAREMLVSFLAAVGKRDEAEAASRAALAIREQLVDEFPTVPEYDEMLAWTACQLAFLVADRGDLSGYQECCDTMLLRSRKVTDPGQAWVFVRACLLLPGGVPDPRQLASLVETARSLDEKNGPYQWILFAQGLYEYRCGRFIEARTACGNSRARATFPAVAVMDQILEAMALYRLDKTNDAREALAAADRLVDDKGPKPDSGDLGAFWYDWLCCRILRREAAALLNKPATETEK
jgi:serine/threonine protein kinase/tetratricopeptide (TPR) repeat protein